LWRLIRHWFARIRGATTGPIGYALHDLLSGDISYHTCVLLFMGIDRRETIIPSTARSSRQASSSAERRMRMSFFPYRPGGGRVSVHALGGCVLSENSAEGVTSAEPATFGQVHGYGNLYVADGAIVPNAVGANPTATISALSEMVAHGITGVAPTADL
jgi:cholesterol oxidase